MMTTMTKKKMKTTNTNRYTITSDGDKCIIQYENKTSTKDHDYPIISKSFDNRSDGILYLKKALYNLYKIQYSQAIDDDMRNTIREDFIDTIEALLNTIQNNTK